MKTVSVIIPMFNAANFIEGTLCSLAAQTHEEIEIVIIDDGSTDGSFEIARRATRSIKFPVRIAQQSNAGASSARNPGMRLARGELIQFLDADDAITPSKIRTQTLLLDGQIDCLSRTAWMTFSEMIPESMTNQDSFPHDTLATDLLRLKIHPQLLIPVHSWLTPRAILDKAGHWNENIGLNDDGEYFSRVLRQARRVLWVDTEYALYRQRPQSLSKTRTPEGMTSLIMSLESCARELAMCDTYDSRDDLARVRAMWSWAAWYLYPDYAAHSQIAEIHAKSAGGLIDMVRGSKTAKAIGALFGWKLVRRIQSARLRDRKTASEQ